MRDENVIDVAFIGHPSSFSHIVSLLEETDGPEAARRVARNEKSFTAFLDWMPSNATHHRPVIQLNGATVRAAMIVCWFLPQIIESRHKLKLAVAKVLEAVDIAAGMGAQVASLGGFTSILAGRRRFDAADAAGITLTAGNALTAALAVARLRAELDARGRPLHGETVAIIGASGDVGGTAAALLGNEPGRLLLVARNQERLERAQLTLGHPNAACVSISEAVAQASVILVATSASQPILTAEDIPSGTIVCDLGYPSTTACGKAGSSKATVLRAGLAEFPAPIQIGAYSRLSQPTHLFGCSTEGVVLAARPDLRHLARSQGQAGKTEALALLNAALSLGIKPAAEAPDAAIAEFSENSV
uniref:Quinate/shikimate 5-dehydrogenase/glutamyl-tRNA reductase domain-containing protein n=1 Tax=mine drainage metagenome TaxID=410659 RepID=E6QWM9_9ZZZZ